MNLGMFIYFFSPSTHIINDFRFRDIPSTFKNESSTKLKLIILGLNKEITRQFSRQIKEAKLKVGISLSN